MGTCRQAIIIEYHGVVDEHETTLLKQWKEATSDDATFTQMMCMMNGIMTEFNIDQVMEHYAILDEHVVHQ